MEQTQETTILDIIKRSDVPETEAFVLASHFSEFEKQAREWKEVAEKITVTSVDQKEEMAKAREGRLILVKVRTGIAKKHKELKEQALKEGRLYDLIKNTLTSFVEPIEEHLEAQENFEKNLIAAQKAELQHERANLLAEYMQDAHSMPLSDMNEDAFNNLLTGQKMAYEARIEAEKKAEEERIKNERLEAEQREAQRLEHERLKAENEAKEKQLAEERAKADAERKKLEEKNKAAQAEADRLAAELKAKEEKEKADLKAKQDAERRHRTAPDKEKLLQFATQIGELRCLPVGDENAQKILDNASGLLVKVVNYIRENAEKL